MDIMCCVEVRPLLGFCMNSRLFSGPRGEGFFIVVKQRHTYRKDLSLLPQKEKRGKMVAEEENGNPGRH